MLTYRPIEPARWPVRLSLPHAEGFTRAGLAGFPSPAEDYAARALDLNERFVKRPSASCFVPFTGEHRPELSLVPPCVLLVDRSVAPRPGHVVVSVVDGEVQVRHWQHRTFGPGHAGVKDRVPPLNLERLGETCILGIVRSTHARLGRDRMDELDNGDFDLNAHFIDNPASSFFMDAAGDSMLEYAVPDPCLLLIDRSILPSPGHVVVAVVDGEIVVKAWHRHRDRDWLVSGGNRYPPIPMSDVDGTIWGVVSSVHRELTV
ncbi:S24 family peptidase [Salinicola sp. NYA28a]